EPPGECRPNHAVIQGLAQRLGARHRGFEMSALEIIDWTLTASGRPNLETVLAKHWVDAYPPFAEAHFVDGFGHADKRFHFAPDWSRTGQLGHARDHAAMPKLPDHMPAIDDVTAERPFRMVTAPAR